MPGAKDWLKKASNDLTASQILFHNQKILDCCVFHTHQCAEKALKSVLVLYRFGVPKTHDLSALLEQCTKIDSEFMLLQEECSNLNSYGQDSRYPNDNFYINRQLAQNAVVMAEKILLTVQKKQQHHIIQ